jgi:hypothetical protein
MACRTDGCGNALSLQDFLSPRFGMDIVSIFHARSRPVLARYAGVLARAFRRQS